MDFKLTKEEQELKEYYEDFFREAIKKAPAIFSHGGGFEAIYSDDEGFAFHQKMAKIMGEKGMLSLPWPKELGGADASIMHQLIFNEAREVSRCPGFDFIGCGMFAPSLLVFANDDQKARLLPPIAKGEVQYCQGWSEPDAGSDLASLQTAAVRDGDEWIINGQKVWTTAAHRSDCMFILVRTDPNSSGSRGLSVFHLDMKTPGIEVRPLDYMNGSHVYNEVFLKDVRVLHKDLIGDEGGGWQVTMATMNFERSGMGFFSTGRKVMERIIQYVKTTKRNGKLLSENAAIRKEIGKIYAGLEAGTMMAFRVGCTQASGDMMAAASVASESKVFGTEFSKHIFDFATKVLGLYGMIEEGDATSLLNVVEEYQSAPGLTIAGGSNEVQRCIISWMAPLNMPRWKLMDPAALKR